MSDNREIVRMSKYVNAVIFSFSYIFVFIEIHLKHRHIDNIFEVVLTETHDPLFVLTLRKKNVVYPFTPQFYCRQFGFKGA